MSTVYLLITVENSTVVVQKPENCCVCVCERARVCVNICSPVNGGASKDQRQAPGSLELEFQQPHDRAVSIPS